MVVELGIVSALEGDAERHRALRVVDAGDHHLGVGEPGPCRKDIERRLDRRGLLTERAQREGCGIAAERCCLQRLRVHEVRPNLPAECQIRGHRVATAIRKVRRPSRLHLETVGILHHVLALRIGEEVHLTACRGTHGEPHFEMVAVAVVPVAHAL